jgi:hypothetical protein
MDEAQEIAVIEAAIAKVDTLLNNKELLEAAEVLGLELSDAIDDLNDSFKRCETVLRKLKVRPGWVPLPISETTRNRKQPLTNCALVWDGNSLLFDSGVHVQVLLKASKEIRIHAAGVFGALKEELFRER